MLAAEQTGAVKKALDKGQQIKAAGAEKAAAVEAHMPASQPAPKAASPKPAAQPPASKPAAQKPAATSPVPAAKKAAAKAQEKPDPFVIPIKPKQEATPSGPLPPGLRGLLVGQANLAGVVKTPRGMLAVVTGPNNRTFFLKPNDQLYNGRVVSISADTLVLEESFIDPLGKQLRREVIKKLATEGR
jgi:Tfp pilus assembly protein PilP